MFKKLLNQLTSFGKIESSNQKIEEERDGLLELLLL